MALLSPSPDAALREAALEAYRTLPAPGPPPGRFWKVDIARIDAESLPTVEAQAGVEIAPQLAAQGVRAYDLATARRDIPGILGPALGSAVDWRAHKFAALNVARRDAGLVIVIPDGVDASAPIAIRRRAGAGAAYPYTLVVAGRRSHATVVSRLEGDDILVSEVVELVAEDQASLTFAAVQTLGPSSRIFSVKAGTAAQDARLCWAIAELGAGLSASSIRSLVQARGAETTIGGIFFADGSQHIDLESEVDHRVGDTRSETIFKSAATGDGQARYVGNIRIRPHAKGSDATLRDDALLLSPRAHIDSIPALEIGSNDVRAFHGATVGAIREDEVFYAMTRGLPRSAAERMIALGFFEPALAGFPTDTLRDDVRDALARKIG